MLGDFFRCSVLLANGAAFQEAAVPSWELQMASAARINALEEPHFAIADFVGENPGSEPTEIKDVSPSETGDQMGVSSSENGGTPKNRWMMNISRKVLLKWMI